MLRIKLRFWRASLASQPIWSSSMHRSWGVSFKLTRESRTLLTPTLTTWKQPRFGDNRPRLPPAACSIKLSRSCMLTTRKENERVRYKTWPMTGKSRWRSTCWAYRSKKSKINAKESPKSWKNAGASSSILFNRCLSLRVGTRMTSQFYQQKISKKSSTLLESKFHLR